MEITDIILVTENYKGTEKNMLMNFTEYMIQFGMKTGKTPSLAAFHTLDLERSKDDRGMWTEVYFSANKSVNARYCVDMDQLCYFLSGRYNDQNAEYYLDEERCSKDCFELLDELVPIPLKIQKPTKRPLSSFLYTIIFPPFLIVLKNCSVTIQITL